MFLDILFLTRQSKNNNITTLPNYITNNFSINFIEKSFFALYSPTFLFTLLTYIEHSIKIFKSSSFSKKKTRNFFIYKILKYPEHK